VDDHEHGRRQVRGQTAEQLDQRLHAPGAGADDDDVATGMKSFLSTATTRSRAGRTRGHQYS
jgi:hypothetical protein